MSAIGVQSQINQDRALWLSTIPTDVIHGNVICDTIIANAGYISTFYSDNTQISTLLASTLQLTDKLDVSTINASSFFTNYAKTSTLQWASDLSGGVGYVNITTDASGVAVDGDPIKFNNLVYFTSTITLVPVSTIVDTDIFAQNGYFSTLSTGSLSTNLMKVNSGLISSLQGDYGSFNRLFVSSLEAIDISGVDGAKYWSQYPTLASSIIFQPSYILSNVNNKLFFAGTELTDVSGGGQDWSLFPAQQDVSMNNFSIRDLSTLQYQDGARLYSQTGNNLFYNGQPVQFGTASNVSQWANYPAVNTIQTGGFPISSLGNINLVANSNIRLLADRVSTVADNGADIGTFADINMTAQNGNKGRINLTANPGFQGLFGEVNVVANGGTVAGIGTGGLVSITANTPLGTLSNATSAIKLSASGVNSYAGAIPPIGSLAGYNFIYGTGGVNICAGLPPTLPNVPLTTYLYGTAGVTTSSDFYVPAIYPYWNGVTTPPDLAISGRYILPNLAQVYVTLSNVKHIYMDYFADIQNAKYVSTVSTVGAVANFTTGQFGSGQFNTLGTNIANTNFLNANYISTSYVQSPLLSTININLSTINGLDWQDISGGVFTTVSSFNTVKTSSFKVSTMSGFFGANTAIGSTIFTDSGIQFIGETSPVGGGRFLSSLREINDAGQNLNIFVSTAFLSYQAGINSNGNVRIGGGGAFDSYFRTINSNVSLSTAQLLANSTITEEITTSSIRAYGGLPLKVASGVLEFESLTSAINNVNTINLNGPQIPVLTINASTIAMVASNTTINSLSTLNLSTAAFNFSSARSFMSNTAFNYPIFVEADHANNTTNSAGVAIAVQGHNLALGQVRNTVEMGVRANGECFIATSWPGQNLEDLYIDATDVVFRDGTFSTIVNLDPYGLITTGAISAPALLVSSINNNNAQVAYANILTLSTMNLIQNSTTLLHWSTATTSCNVSFSNYDVTVQQNGVYKTGVSFQFHNQSGSDKVEYFFQKNNVTIPYTGTIHTVANNTESTTYVEIVEPMNSNDTLQVGMYTTSADVTVSTINGSIEVCPAAILTVYKLV